VRLNIRNVTVGNRHAERGNPDKVALCYRWLLDHPGHDLPPIAVRPKPNGTYRIYDGRHRFLAYVLAEREEIPAVIASIDVGSAAVG
jgi:hypothetical protein